MTVQKMATIKRFIGLSTDTKPVDSATDRILPGSTFHEYDTGLTYITHDGTLWVPYEYTLSTVNVSMNRDLPFLTEFWETESLLPAVWETVIDGAGTEAFASSGGRMYYDMDTAAAAADTDVFLNSKYRWICVPSVFGDSNTIIQRLILEWEIRAVTTVADHDNTHFFMGLSATKSNEIGLNNLIGFYLDTDVLKGRTDNGGVGGSTGAIAATITDWNKYRITIDAASVTFTLNGVDETPLTTAAQQPDIAMYLVLGTRAEGANAVGLNVGPVRVWYNEVI